MRLYYTPASPFARKCRILIREKGLTERVEEVRADPINGDEALAAVNPMMQVPALVDDAGVAWTDSPVICARLDAMGDPRFIPDGEPRWRVIRREVLADGVMELGVKLRLENLRAEGERSPSWSERWRAGVMRGIAASERETPPEAPLDLASVAIVCALTWLDLRFPDLGWRDAHPRLAALQNDLEQRPSFAQTKPA
ncbi:glutathione S-transferase family protein [alpha proteobacterium U9-1i]|nr:glutathione S-transferase family protein [alpha proteobacterium U9-1i]